MKVFGFILFVLSIFILGMHSSNTMYKYLYGDIDAIVSDCENNLRGNEKCVLIALPIKEVKE